MEHKIVEIAQNLKKTETLLNELSQEGWHIIGFSQYQVLLERKLDEPTILNG